MPRYRITVAYDGTGLIGWQRQESGTSIQRLLEDALFPFENRRIPVVGASRTDAGVHALGQVAAFTLDQPADPAALVRALNARLPPAVRVFDAAPADAKFNPRFDALAKTYRYRIFTGAVLSPFEYRYAWHLPVRLDVDAMNRAAAALVGRHDFVAFQSAGSDVESTERELFESRIEIVAPAGALPSDVAPIFGPASAPVFTPASDVASVFRPASWIEYIARGDGFLRHMVRAIVGSLVEIGRGKRGVGWMVTVLESHDRASAGPTAPAEGLCLVSVEYPPLAAQP